MRGRGIRDERGMVSILGISALGILLFLSAALYAVDMSHTKSAARFLSGTALRNAAEDGVRLGLSRLNADTAAAAQAENAASRHILLLTGSSGDASFEVYARKKDGKILLLGVSRMGDDSMRAVAVAQKTGGRYVVNHWER